MANVMTWPSAVHPLCSVVEGQHLRDRAASEGHTGGRRERESRKSSLFQLHALHSLSGLKSVLILVNVSQNF